jgi:predicted enzyme related to lactoylglutathione lyase
MGEESQKLVFAFTKLVVQDLEREAAFYRAVCGYGEGDVLKGDIAGRPVEEIILRTPDGALDLILLSYLGEAPSSSSSEITAFDTGDLDACQAHLLDAGGTVVEAIKCVTVGTDAMRIGIFADPEGHLLEVMER